MCQQTLRNTAREQPPMIRRASFARETNRPASGSRLAIVALAALTLALVGCGDRKKDKAASQAAARVNKEEITVHQINLLLQQQRGLKTEQVDAVGKQVLEFLIDQELAVQRTRELKIDQDQRVLLQLEAAKRDVLARAYAERIGESAVAPNAEEVKKYYDDHPALFRERRIYSIQELAIEATPEQVAALRDQVARVKSASELVDHLKANSFRFNANQGVRAAEQLPADALDKLTRMKDAQLVLLPTATGALVIVLVGSRSEPLDEARARPGIEQFLLGDAKRKRIESDLKTQRAAAKVEYLGKFSEPAASAGMAGAAQAPAAAPAASGAMSAEDISRGMGVRK
jgi:EpsD family peptidyl-prolyl cis-trans isomerase